MEQIPEEKGHYRVVRFYTDFKAGLVREVLAADLTLDKAAEVADQNRGIPGEDIVIQDQTRRGLEAELILDQAPRRHEDNGDLIDI